jgi:hypothetical protein
MIGLVMDKPFSMFFSGTSMTIKGITKLAPEPNVLKLFTSII